MLTPEDMISNAERVLGKVARTIGEEILKEYGEKGFKENYIGRIAKITGNTVLARNIVEAE